MTVRGLLRDLARLDLDLVLEAALVEQGAVLAAAAHAAGAKGGDVTVAASEAVVGWRSATLQRREAGEVGAPPAPVLVPLAIAEAPRIATAIGMATADAVRGI